MTVLGLDIAGKWWGVGDWRTARSRGIRFAFVRVGAAMGNGTIETEWLYPEQLEGASSVGILTSPYWYFIPRADWQKQVDAFINELKISRPWAWTMPAAIDVEESYVTPTKATQYIANFANAIREELNMKRLILYTRQEFWDRSTLRDVTWSWFDLWASRENSTLSSPWSDNRFRFRDWVDTDERPGWTFWQYSFKNELGAYYGFGAPFNNRYGKLVYPAKGMDLNRFNGDLAGLYAYAGVEMPPPPPPPTLEQRIASMEAFLAQTQGYGAV